MEALGLGGAGTVGGASAGAGTAATVGATGAEGASLAVPAAGSGATAVGGGSLATIGASLLNGLQNTFASAHGPEAGFVGPPGGTPYQNLISGLSQGGTQGLYGQGVPGSAANSFGQFAGNQLMQRLMQPGQAQQAPPAQILRRYLPPYG